MNNVINTYNNTMLIVNDFCDFIDKIVEKENNANLNEFLIESQKYISRLYSEFCTLPNLDTDYFSNHKEMPKSIKEKRLARFYFVSEKLKNVLGEHDLYWNVFDPHNLEKDEPSQSRLSNDIGEIYDDFKRCKDEFDNFNLSTEEKIVGLKSSFTNHWYDHASKLLTAISWLLYHKIDWEEEI